MDRTIFNTPGLTIFDMDDVMYYLNKKVARIKKIDERKFTQFCIFDNPNMTAEEKELVTRTYQETDTYRDIEFIQPIIDLINHVYYEYPEHPVHIVSNCSTRPIADVKMEQAVKVLDLPEERIHMNVIDMYTQSLQKKLPDDMFIFVDDSPHNIVMSKAAHRIMPARRHNANRMVKGMIDNVPVDRPATPSQLRKLVIGYLEEERRSGYE